jgi:hypothetical protein
MGVVGFFRRGGRIIPIIKRTGVGRLVSSSKSYAKAKIAKSSVSTKISNLYKDADDLMALSKRQRQEIRPNFPLEKVSGMNEAESIKKWHKAKTLESSQRYKSLSGRVSKIKEARKGIMKKAAIEVGAFGSAVGLGAGALYKKRGDKK